MDVTAWTIIVAEAAAIVGMATYIVRLHNAIDRAKEAHIRMAERVANLAKNGNGAGSGSGGQEGRP